MKKLLLPLVFALALFSCSKEKRECVSSSERTFSFAGFSRISAGETFALQIRQGTSFDIKATGCSNDLEDLSVNLESGGTLVIKYNRYQSLRNRLNLEIMLPLLSNLALSGTATANLTGFGQQTASMRAVVSGAAVCSVDGLPGLVKAELSGTGKLNLSGTATDLLANLSGDARLNAYTATIDDADVYTSGTAKIYLQVQKSLAAFASGDSRIYYKGNPASINIEQSGTAKVIKE